MERSKQIDCRTCGHADIRPAEIICRVTLREVTVEKIWCADYVPREGDPVAHDQ